MKTVLPLRRPSNPLLRGIDKSVSGNPIQLTPDSSKVRPFENDERLTLSFGAMSTTRVDELRTAPARAQRSTVRSPLTGLRLGVTFFTILLAMFPLVGSRGDESEFSGNFKEILGGLPERLVNLVVGSLQLTTLAAFVVGVVVLVYTKRYTRIGAVTLAGTLATAILTVISRIVGGNVLNLSAPDRGTYGPAAAFPTTIGLAILCSSVLVESPWRSARWRHGARLVVVFAIGARLGSALAEPSTILIALVVGAAGSAVTQLVIGVPDRRPSADDVAAVVTRCGYDVSSVEVANSANYRSVEAFTAHLRSGESFFVRVVGRESWVAQLPVRIYRSLRFRDLGDDNPFVAVKYRVEHEALCSLKAHSDGVPTPRLMIVAQFPNDSMLLAFEAKQLRTFRQLAEIERTDHVLRQAWKAVATLHRSQAAHRRLNSNHVYVASTGDVLLVDFSDGELGASDYALAADVAEMLANTAAIFGVTEAVQAAVDAMGLESVSAALPRMQPLALTRLTRNAVKEANCLEDLCAEIQGVTGTETVALHDLERLKPRTIITIAMAALGLWALVPQILGAGDVWGHLRSANLWWGAIAIVLSIVTYFGAAIALEGSLPERLPFGPNLAVQFATSFVGVAAPGGALALSARFLHRRGIAPAVAVAAVAVDTIAGVMVHFSLLGVFVVWAGSSGLKSFNLPTLGILVVAGVGVLAAAVVVGTVPKTRALVAARLMPSIRRGVQGMAETAKHPSNLLALFGGSAAITLGYVLALEVSVLAFGTSPSFTSIALVYLVGSIISSVAPTPGGIGAVEATLVAGLTSAGMRSDTALGAVLLFRFATFWLPMLPGWFAFTALQKTGNV